LLLKQSYHANERVRSEQTKCVHSTVSNIREGIMKCNHGIKNFYLDTEHTVRSLTSDATINIIKRQNYFSREFFLEIKISSLN
jgi:hypothetical protein